MNKEGETKGSTALTHLVDIDFYVSRSERVLKEYGKGYFEVRVGKKCRGGRVDEEFYCVWKHYDTKADIESDNRVKDEIWAKSHGHLPFDINELAKEIIRKVNEENKPKPSFFDKIGYGIKNIIEGIQNE